MRLLHTKTIGTAPKDWIGALRKGPGVAWAAERLTGEDVLSVGSGWGYPERLLALARADLNIDNTDVNPEYGLVLDISSQEIPGGYDSVLSFGGTFFLTNDGYRRFLRSCARAGIKRAVILEAGVEDLWFHRYCQLRDAAVFWRDIGTFFGYARSPGDLLALWSEHDVIDHGRVGDYYAVCADLKGEKP